MKKIAFSLLFATNILAANSINLPIALKHKHQPVLDKPAVPHSNTSIQKAKNSSKTSLDVHPFDYRRLVQSKEKALPNHN